MLVFLGIMSSHAPNMY